MFNAYSKLVKFAKPAKKISLLLAAGAAASVFAVQAGAAGMPDTAANYGAAVAAQGADRSVTITPQTTSVNVNDGDTVTFVKGDMHFTWHFATLRGTGNVKLSAIAPAGLMGDRVVVYIDSNPLYRN